MYSPKHLNHHLASAHNLSHENGRVLRGRISESLRPNCGRHTIGKLNFKPRIGMDARNIKWMAGSSELKSSPYLQRLPSCFPQKTDKALWAGRCPPWKYWWKFRQKIMSAIPRARYPLPSLYPNQPMENLGTRQLTYQLVTRQVTPTVIQPKGYRYLIYRGIQRGLPTSSPGAACSPPPRSHEPQLFAVLDSNPIHTEGQTLPIFRDHHFHSASRLHTRPSIFRVLHG